MERLLSLRNCCKTMRTVLITVSLIEPNSFSLFLFSFDIAIVFFNCSVLRKPTKVYKTSSSGGFQEVVLI